MKTERFKVDPASKVMKEGRSVSFDRPIIKPGTVHSWEVNTAIFNPWSSY